MCPAADRKIDRLEQRKEGRKAGSNKQEHTASEQGYLLLDFLSLLLSLLLVRFPLARNVYPFVGPDEILPVRHVFRFVGGVVVMTLFPLSCNRRRALRVDLLPGPV